MLACNVGPQRARSGATVIIRHCELLFANQKCGVITSNRIVEDEQLATRAKQRTAAGRPGRTRLRVAGAETEDADTGPARGGVQSIGVVPEPATWAMMLLGFGFVGGAMRSAKRRRKLALSHA